MRATDNTSGLVCYPAGHETAYRLTGNSRDRVAILYKDEKMVCYFTMQDLEVVVERMKELA